MLALDLLEDTVVLDERRPNTSTVLPFYQYDVIIVSFSGGKDSLACLLHLLAMGVPKKKIELWHQHVDGAPGSRGLMDWPCTEDYCRKVAAAFDIPIYFQWRVGGFEHEMLRDNQETECVQFQLPDGTIGQAGGKSGKFGTRLKFPQTSADLSVRWCSASLKIDVASIAINNDPRFKKSRILLITGERREESNARSRYAEIEEHRTTNRKRRTDQYRIIIDWNEKRVWDIIKKYKVNPHPAYRLGWGRVSCMACIFGDKNQWASVRDLAPNVFGRIMNYESRFGVTIKAGLGVFNQAILGKSFIKDAPESLKRLALSKVYTDPVFIEDWELPKGAFRRCGGPT